ncbi:hypothetical protein [Candidatus Galacturonibacter soehngenii]|uniref:Uncharacterized protein n=1 Tax=Candidatus Galacturonatibacter soehngenii TaxID=2307010 RepID=A0A7V7QNG5_9FIRM|nr:hypothetical protein [Candidatus Galacturonibacter soehngenii]KAB1440572.1 hypothetical protein F7O84_01715 [Candidatus Galacturonibacter soehngenii]
MKVKKDIYNSIDNLSEKYVNAASTTDSTGLIPSNPASEEELESYKEIYNFQVPLEDESENK